MKHKFVKCTIDAYVDFNQGFGPTNINMPVLINSIKLQNYYCRQLEILNLVKIFTRKWLGRKSIFNITFHHIGLYFGRELPPSNILGKE